MIKGRRTMRSTLAILTATIMIFSASAPAMAFDGDIPQNEAAIEESVEKAEPAKEEAPTEVAEPVKEEAPAEVAEPVKEEAPAEVAEPVKEEAPAEVAEPVKEEAPAEVAEPVKEEAPAEVAEPVKEEAPIEETAPAEKTAPAKEESTIVKVAPALSSAPAKADGNIAEDPDDDSWGYANSEKTIKWRLVEKDGKQTLIFEVLDYESIENDNDKALTKLLFNDSHEGNKSAKEYLAGIVEVIEIPKSITGIGWTARYSNDGKDLYDGDYPINQSETGLFQSFNKLTKVEIEDDNAIVRIGWSAFRKCTNLSIFDFSKLTRLEEIMNQAFSPCGLTEADLSNCTSLTTIYQSAFYGSNLATLILPEGLEVIGGSAFASTKIDEVTIPETVTEIHDKAFNNCKNLETLTFEDASNLEIVGKQTFSGTGRSASQLNPFTEVTDEATNTTAKTRPSAHELFNGKADQSAFDFTGLDKNEDNRWSTVTFVDEDGNSILERTDYLKGETPVYGGEAPGKEADDEFTYEFDGWTPEIGTVEGNVTYTATYKAIEIVDDDDDDEDGVDGDTDGDIDDDDSDNVIDGSDDEDSDGFIDGDNDETSEDHPVTEVAEEEITPAAAATIVTKGSARPAATGIFRAANTETTAEEISDGQVPAAEGDTQISNHEVPLTDAAPQEAEKTEKMNMIPFIIAALGIGAVIAFIFRRKNEEESEEI